MQARGHVGDEADGCIADFEFSCEEGFGGACHSYDSAAEGLEHPDLRRRLVPRAFSAGHYNIVSEVFLVVGAGAGYRISQGWTVWLRHVNMGYRWAVVEGSSPRFCKID